MADGQTKLVAPAADDDGRGGTVSRARTLAVAVVLMLLKLKAYEAHGRLKAYALQDRLLAAHTDEVTAIVRDMASYRWWLDPMLRHVLTEEDRNPRQMLHVSLALLPVDSRQVSYLFDRLLDADPAEIPLIRDALASHKEDSAASTNCGTCWNHWTQRKAVNGFRPPRPWHCTIRRKAIAGSEFPKPSPTICWPSPVKNPNHFATLVNQFRPVGPTLRRAGRMLP